jgi:DNA-binding CsgD family transcriptional regulator
MTEAGLMRAAMEWASPLDDMIGAIGSTAFPGRIARYLREICGVELAFIFRLVESRPVELISISCDGADRVERVRNTYLGGKWWQFDDEIGALSTGNGEVLQMLKTDFKQSASPRLRRTFYNQLNIRDRVLICGRFDGDPLVLSLTRPEQSGPFETGQVDSLLERSATTLSIVAKHCDIAMRARRLPRLLTDLSEIERRIASVAELLTPREAGVCARYLYGMSTSGIAADLGIGTETVVTYRKRLYEHLSICSHRELLLWYLDLYSQVQ